MKCLGCLQIGSSDKLERFVDAVVDWKSNTLTQELFADYYNYFETLSLSIGGSLLFRADTVWAHMVMKELQNFDPRLRDYFVAVTCLRVAYAISINSPTENLLELLWTLFDPCTVAMGDISISRQNSGSLLCIRRAVKLLTLDTVRSNTLEMLHNEMSKAFLQHSFVYGHESTYCVVHVLLAALHYKSRDYQAASDHCKQVLNQCNRGLQYIGAEYLPKIDESVDAVFGLVLLYQYVQRKALKPDTQQRSIKLAFTTQLLAHYFHSKISTAAESERRRMRSYRLQHLRWTESPLLCDVLLFKELEMQLGECREIFTDNTDSTDDAENASSSMDTRLLVTMLELVALEKLVTVRQVVVRELHSEKFPVLNEFEVLYAYKCGLLEECLDMCCRNVAVLLRAGCPRYQRYQIVIPEFLSMVDGEVLSLCGIIRLSCPVLFLPRCM